MNTPANGRRRAWGRRDRRVWGRRYAQADRAVREATIGVANVRARGQAVPDALLADRGEKITRRADVREAAANERRGLATP